MSNITFKYLISLAVQKHLSVQLMDVVTAYLYGSLDSDIYMKVPDGISVPDPNANRNMYCVKLNKSILHGTCCDLCLDSIQRFHKEPSCIYQNPVTHTYMLSLHPSTA